MNEWHFTYVLHVRLSVVKFYVYARVSSPLKKPLLLLSRPLPPATSPTPLQAAGQAPTDRNIVLQSVRCPPAPIKSLTTLPPIRGGSNPAGSGHGGGEDSAVDALVGLCQPRLGGWAHGPPRRRLATYGHYGTIPFPPPANSVSSIAGAGAAPLTRIR